MFDDDGDDLVVSERLPLYGPSPKALAERQFELKDYRELEKSARNIRISKLDYTKVVPSLFALLTQLGYLTVRNWRFVVPNQEIRYGK